MGFNPAIRSMAMTGARVACNNHHTAYQDSTKNEYHTSIQVDTQNPTGISPEGIGCICAVSLLALIVMIKIIKDVRNF